MGVFSTFFNPRKPRGFQYTPRYHNPEKEERDRRHKRIVQDVKREQGEVIPDEEFESNIRGQFRARNEMRTHFKHRKNVRIILLFVVLLYLAYKLTENI